MDPGPVPGLMRQKRFREAISELELMIRKNPCDKDLDYAHKALGDCHSGLMEFSEARNAYEKCLEINPEFIDAQCNLGHVCVAIGRYGEALEHYLYVLARNRAHSYAQEGIGHLIDRIHGTGSWDVFTRMPRDKQLGFVAALNEENRNKFTKLRLATKQVVRMDSAEGKPWWQ